MNYDVWSPGIPTSTTIGPNAPITDDCAPSDVPKRGSATQAIRDWTAAGIPSSQLLLGVPSYGQSFRVRREDYSSLANNKYPKFDRTNPPTGDKWDGGPGVDICGNKTDQMGSFNFWGLMDAGYLDRNGTSTSVVQRYWDKCSQTVSILVRRKCQPFTDLFNSSHSYMTQARRSSCLTMTQSRFVSAFYHSPP